MTTSSKGLRKKAESTKDLEDRLDKLSDRLNKRLRGYKIKSRLSKKGKSSIPGFTYWFSTK